MWPAAYDGGYLFVDGGSGRMWLRRSNGTVDYNSPFADVSFSVADMASISNRDGSRRAGDKMQIFRDLRESDSHRDALGQAYPVE